MHLLGIVIKKSIKSKNLVVTYKYDAWGKVITVNDTTENNIGTINPFRYRSYYYDEETKLYYLNSRYYNPEWCRFINVDEYSGDIGDQMSHNMYCYSFNNPINYHDDNGEWPKWAKKVAVAVGIVAVTAAVAVVTVSTFGSGTVPAVIAVSAAKGAAIGAVTGAAIGAGQSVISNRVSTGSWKGTKDAALNGMGDGALTGSITGTVTGAASGTGEVLSAASKWDRGSFNSSYQSMKYHYNKHVIKEGLNQGNNIIKYTNDAMNFAKNNASSFKYKYNFKYKNASWNFTSLNGIGGEFIDSNKVITFWYIPKK